MVLQLPHVAEIHALDHRLHDRNALAVCADAFGKNLRVVLARSETPPEVNLVVIRIDDHVVVIVPVDVGMLEAAAVQQATDLDAVLISGDDRKAGFCAFDESKRAIRTFDKQIVSLRASGRGRVARSRGQAAHVGGGETGRAGTDE